MSSTKPVNHLSGHLAALFSICVWGITFIATKLLLVDFTPIETMFYRLLLAVLALFIISPPRIRDLRFNLRSLRSEWKIMAAGLCGVTLYFICQNIALSYTQAANAGVLVSVAPLFTALVSRVILKEPLKANFLLGFSLAMAGILLVTFSGSGQLKLNPLGDLLTILAALAWAFYGVFIKQVGTSQQTILVTTRKVFLYGLLFLLPLLPFFEFRPDLGRLIQPANLLNLIFLGVIASALCYITWNVAVGQLGPVKTSAYLYLIPVITIIFSLLVLHETITLLSLGGMILILSGMAISEQEKRA